MSKLMSIQKCMGKEQGSTQGICGRRDGAAIQCLVPQVWDHGQGGEVSRAHWRRVFHATWCSSMNTKARACLALCPRQGQRHQIPSLDCPLHSTRAAVVFQLVHGQVVTQISVTRGHCSGLSCATKLRLHPQSTWVSP